jgi:hypothetical protein
MNTKEIIGTVMLGLLFACFGAVFIAMVHVISCSAHVGWH